MFDPHPRMGLGGIGIGLLLLVGSAVIEATTKSNASAGTVMGLILILVSGSQLLWAFVKRRRGRDSDSHE